MAPIAKPVNSQCSAAVEYAKTKWQSVISSAHHSMNEEGIPVLVESHSVMTSNVIEMNQRAAAPIQDIEPSCLMSKFESSQPSAPVDAQNLVQVTIINNNLDDSSLSPIEQSRSSAVAQTASAQLSSFETTIKPEPKISSNKLDSSFFSTNYQPSSLIVSDILDSPLLLSRFEHEPVLLIDFNLGEQLVAKIDDIMVVTRNEENTVNVGLK